MVIKSYIAIGLMMVMARAHKSDDLSTTSQDIVKKAKTR